MSEELSSELPKIIGCITDTTYLAGGEAEINVSIAKRMDVSEAEAVEILARDFGTDTSEVIPLSEPDRRVRRRGSVAFSASRWRSSWDPKADPNMN